jgi:hypothetical protein
MIITINRKHTTDQSMTITIDTGTFYTAQAMQDALKLTLELDGYSKEKINDIFGIEEDVKCVKGE